MKTDITTVKRSRGAAGHSFTEFTITLAAMLSVALTAMLFLSVFSQHGAQLLRLIGVEAP